VFVNVRDKWRKYVHGVANPRIEEGYGTEQNIVFVSVCLCSLGLKVPAIVEEVKTSLAAGLCVVIGLQTTGEVCIIIIIIKR